MIAMIGNIVTVLPNIPYRNQLANECRPTPQALLCDVDSLSQRNITTPTIIPTIDYRALSLPIRNMVERIIGGVIEQTRNHKCAIKPGAPIVPLRGVKDKTRKVPDRGFAYVTPDVSELSCGKGQHIEDRRQGREFL